jgi:AcrR family transcriptional regulator
MTDQSVIQDQGMARPRDPDKRRRILDAAVRVFSRDGYRRAAVSDIADEAGVAKGGLYLYFPSKVVLFGEAFLAGFDADREALREAVEHGRDPERTLRALFAHWADLEADFESLMAMFLDFLAECGRGSLPEEIRDRAAGIYLEMRGLVASLLRVGIRRKKFRRGIDADATAQGIMAFWDGLLAARLVIGDEVEVARSSRSFLRTVLRGIRA